MARGVGLDMIAALIPAAGRSLRMGRPKLILPVGGVPLIARVVDALRDGGAGRVIVVAPPVDEPGVRAMLDAVAGRGVETVVAASPTADMRETVELGLGYLANGPEPSAILLAPGDSPGLVSATVAKVIARAADAPGRIVVPHHNGRRGHPVLLPWHLAREITRLPPGVGVNALLAAHPDEILTFDADDPGILADLDTPEDYRRWSGT
jgi:molybdenum cofactor cytidylyltransferase